MKVKNTAIKSTLKEPRYHASCKHCNTSFGDYTMADLIEHLSEHEIGVHFEDVRIKNMLEPEFLEEECGCEDEGFCEHED